MSRQTTPAPFRVFVYGTLKRGFSNHEYFCRGVTAIEEAVICGRLYALNTYIPALAIPDASVLAHGSLDYASDHRCQRDIVVDSEHPASTDDWRMIHGEVLTFTEPERLARLAQDLARDFHIFYDRCPILRDDTPPEVRDARLVLLAATKITLHNVLTLIGVSAPDRM